MVLVHRIDWAHRRSRGLRKRRRSSRGSQGTGSLPALRLDRYERQHGRSVRRRLLRDAAVVMAITAGAHGVCRQVLVAAGSRSWLLLAAHRATAVPAPTER